MKSFLQNNDIEIHSMHNEGKSVIAERFMRTLKNKIYKYLTSVPKIVYIDEIDDIVNKYNNTYHSTIKIKLVDVKSSTSIDFIKENNEKDPKFKVGDIVMISKCKNIFAKCYTPNWSEELFMIKEVENILPWTYVINDLDGEKICWNFLRKRIAKKQIKKNLELKK